MSILTDISENLQKGKAKVVKELVQQAIDEGIPVADSQRWSAGRYGCCRREV